MTHEKWPDLTHDRKTHQYLSAILWALSLPLSVEISKMGDQLLRKTYEQSLERMREEWRSIPHVE